MTEPVAATIHPNHEPSAWLRGAIARRLRDVRRAGLDPDSGDATIVAPIGRSGFGREDRTCDRCRRYVEPGTLFWPFIWRAARMLMLSGGFCDRCNTLERWES